MTQCKKWFIYREYISSCPER